MFRVLGIYNFGERLEKYLNDLTSRTKNYLMRLGNVTKGKKYVDLYFEKAKKLIEFC